MLQLTLNPQKPEKCKKMARNKIQTNSRYKNFTQSMYTAGDIDQFNSSRIRQSLTSKDFPIEEMNSNIFSNKEVIPFIWNKYKDLDSRAVSNTFKYIFYKLKKGIFIRIANNELQTFLPFTNAHYKNEFADKLQVSPKWKNIQSFLNYVSQKSGYYKSQDHIPLDEWVANNALVRFEFQRNEGDNNVVTLFNMFKTLCEKRNVPDIEFFVNRRDFPQLKNNDTEPYNHIYDSQHFPLLSHKYDKYAPLLSGSTSKNFADIAFPTYEDWARAVNQETGNVFPYSCREYPKIIKSNWKNKINKAVFRGATTGAGVTLETNQRLKALDICEKNPDLLDVGITSWNLRPRKYEGEKYLQTIERSKYPLSNKLNLQDQSKYKYILTLEGHVAAYRLSYELSTESVILLAGSKWKMWYYNFLKPLIHYVPVAEDLHDLIEQIEWCRNHDKECEQIALNAKKFYDTYLGTRGILDFLQKQLWELSQSTGSYDYLPDLLLWSIEDERQQLKNSVVYNNLEFKFNLPPGPRCIGRLDGTLKVFQSKTIKDLKLINKKLFENVNGVIKLYETNNFWIVGKQANNDAKILEHIHEAYIGLNAINSLVAKVPNFAYVYGLLKPNEEKEENLAAFFSQQLPVQFADGSSVYGPMLFVEYIEGPSLMHWLLSKEYNFNQLIDILIQINLALSVAQNYIGFVHYDLYPWNVVLQNVNSEAKFNYFINPKTILSFKNDKKNNYIPIIIDYGKSRSIVFEEKYGLIDHGFANIFKSNSIIDTLTLLFGVINILKDKKEKIDNELNLLEFGDLIKLNNYKDSKHHGKYGSLFNFSNPLNAKPIDFINFLVKKYPYCNSNLTVTSNFSYKTEKGNAIQTINQMLIGNENEALLQVLLHIDKSVFPTSTDVFFQNVIKNTLSRRLEWIDSEIKSKGDASVKKKWNLIKQNFNYQPKAITTNPIIKYPTPNPIKLDDEITLRYIRTNTINAIDDNWSQIWMWCIEAAYLFKIATPETFGNFIKLDGFKFQNNIASNNTLAKLKKKLI
jgi:hypothetical protein